MKKRHVYLQMMTIFLTLALIVPGASAQEDYYADKTVELIITRGAGGGADTTGRHMAQLLSKFIPGNPTVRVKNNPGGALVFNDVYFRGKPDGLTIALSTGGDALRWVLGTEGFDFELDKMKLLASSGQSTVIYTRPDVANNLTELLKRDKIRAGHSAGRGGTVSAVEEITMQVLGVNVLRAYGYKSYGEVELAVLRGELDLSGNNTIAYLGNTAARVEDGEFTPLFQMGFVSDAGNYKPDPRLVDIPLFVDAYHEATGKNLADQPLADAVAAATSIANMGYTFWMHQDTPDKLYNIMTQAWKDMVNSPELKEMTKKKMGTDDSTLVGEDALAVFNRFKDLPPEITEMKKK